VGLFSISPARRFLESGESRDIYSGTRVLLSGFLRAMRAQNIHFKYGMHPQMRELAQKGAMGGADSQRFGAGGLLESIGSDEGTIQGDRRVVVESWETAVETCASRMSKLPEIPGVSRGISFGIDTEPSGSKTSWSLAFHRGPLPLLEIELSDHVGFHPPQSFRNSMIQSKCAHIVNGAKGPITGGGDPIFLMLKRFKLFPYSKGNSSSEVVAAGQRLRRLCREVWQKLSGDPETLYELSSWEWKRKRFVRTFDKVLLEHAGSGNLDALLKEMGTRLDSWLPACE
jgi:hypothetical protein